MTRFYHVCHLDACGFRVPVCTDWVVGKEQEEDSDGLVNSLDGENRKLHHVSRSQYAEVAPPRTMPHPCGRRHPP